MGPLNLVKEKTPTDHPLGTLGPRQGAFPEITISLVVHRLGEADHVISYVLYCSVAKVLRKKNKQESKHTDWNQLRSRHDHTAPGERK